MIHPYQGTHVGRYLSEMAVFSAFVLTKVTLTSAKFIFGTRAVWGFPVGFEPGSGKDLLFMLYKYLYEVVN